MASSYGVFSQGFGRIDQGVDFGGSGPIPALGKAVVTDVGTAPIIQGYTVPYIVYQLLGGPYKGQYVYVAENFTPQVKVGDHLRRGQSVGYAHGSSPYIEVGFNQTAKGWTAYGSPSDRNSAAGTRMYRLIQSEIGAARVTAPPSHKSGSGYSGSPAGLGTQGPKNKPGKGGGGFNWDYWFNPENPQVLGDLGGAAKHIPGVVQAESIANFLGMLSSPAFWIRLLEMIGGGIMIVMGLYLLARQVGLPSVTSAVPGPVGAAARSASTIGPSENPSRAGTRRVVHQHYLEEPASTRRKRLAAAAAPSEDIPF